jgi:hypothetical protein
VKGTLGCCALALFDGTASAQSAKASETDPEKEFVKNWLADLFDTMEQELDDRPWRLMAGCGRLLWRFQFGCGYRSW